jgi:hypothetical protein
MDTLPLISAWAVAVVASMAVAIKVFFIIICLLKSCG